MSVVETILDKNAESTEPFTRPRDFLISVSFSLLSFLLALAFLASRQPSYKATGSFFVIRASSSLSSLNNLVGGSSGSGSLGDYVFVLLKSNELMDAVAGDLNLWKNDTFWNGERTRNPQRLREAFDSQTAFSIDGGYIEVSASTREAQLSANLVSAIMGAVEARLRAESKGRTLSFEERVRKLEGQIDVADTKLETFRTVSGLLVEAQMNERVATRADLKRRLVALRAERSGIDAQSMAPGDLADMLKMESGRAQNSGVSNELTQELLEVEEQLTLAPEQLREYAALVRKSKALESLYGLAIQNLEVARSEETKELNPLRVVDRPKVPDEPERTHRLRYLLAV